MHRQATLAAPISGSRSAADFGQQRGDHRFSLAQVSAAKQVQVVEEVVQLVQRPALPVSAGKGPGSAVGSVEAGRKAAKQLAHREVALTVAVMDSRVEQCQPARLVHGRVARPQVAMQQAWRWLMVRLHLGDRNVDLIDDHVDMAVRFGALPDSSMVATPIGDMRTVTCASPAVLERHGMPDRPDALLDYPIVAVEIPLPTPAWRYRVPGSDTTLEIPVVPRLAVTTTEAAAQAAIQGVGVTRLLHYQVADAVVRGELRIVLETYEMEPAPVHLVHASRGRMPLKMRRFLDFSAPRLRETLRQISEAGRG